MNFDFLKRNPLYLVFLMAIIGFSSCKTIDLRTDYALQNNTESEVEKGKRLLKATYLKMGYDYPKLLRQ